MLVIGALVAGCSSDPNPRPDSRLGPLGELLDVDERLGIEGLEGPVDVVRDRFGRVHLYASTRADAYRAQGYLVARDRHLQLDFLRRLAQGRLAAVLGHLDPTLVEDDIAMRHLGLGRVAAAQYAELGDDAKAVLDAYADGVTQLFRRIRAGEPLLPSTITDRAVDVLPRSAFTDWTGADSLAIARLLMWELSYSGGEELELQELLDRMKSVFRADAESSAYRRRSGIERDLIRFAPADPATVVDGFASLGDDGAAIDRQRERRLARRPEVVPRSPSQPGALEHRYPPARAALSRTAGFRRALDRVRERLGSPPSRGSNNWAVAPALSASGHALVANDPHLALTAPSFLWPVSLHVTGGVGRSAPEELHVSGLAFPGVPVVILGHNRHLAWAMTNADYDVTDVYAETLTPDGTAVRYRGAEVPFETVEEVIEVRGGESVPYTVQIVPHHGPVVPTIVDGRVVPADASSGAFSVRWTAMETTDEIGAVLGLMDADDVDEGRQALGRWSVPAQNWLLADGGGNILWTTHARVPLRDERALDWSPATYEGLLPCLVLPGDGTAEWTGSWDPDRVPWIKNPSAGYLATANSDPLGTTLDNDPSNDRQPNGDSAFLGCSFSVGFRQGRIRELIDGAKDPLRPEDLAAIQADVRSPLGAALVPSLLLAIANARQEHTAPGSYPALSALVDSPAYDDEQMGLVQDALTSWQDEADFVAASGIDPVTNLPLPSAVAPEAPPEQQALAVEARAARATLIFNTWLVRLIPYTLGDELAALGRDRPTRHDVRALLHLFASEPQSLATFDGAVGDSALWDDLETEQVRETRQERMVRALLDALGWLGEHLGPDADGYRWGALHTVRFEAIVPIFGALSIPPVTDPLFPDGFPRHGDSFVVDASGFSLRQRFDEDPSFAYSHGPVQRLVVELDSGGPRAYNALPGGAVWDPASPHFADQAEHWRLNQVHPVPFALDDVVAVAERRLVATPPR